MAELEALYYSGESYRMAAIRAKTLSILLNIYKMIGNLIEMSGGKYRELENIFEKIKNDIDAIICRTPVQVPRRLYSSLDRNQQARTWADRG